MPNSQDPRFDRLEALIEKGFAALAQDIADSKTEITDVKSAVAQLGAEMREGFADIRTELTDIRHRLEALESAVQNISGYAKEIDHLIERVSAVEKHLGLRANIAG
jgi:methyl-accepting chemotaxis protein